MDKKYGYIAVGVLSVCAFALGRFMAPERVRVETKIVEVEKKSKKVDTEVEKNKETKIVEVTYPDGRKEVTTTITEGSTKKQTKDEKSKTVSEHDSLSETTYRRSKFHLSALIGSQLSGLSNLAPIYGVHAQKEILGPISVGVWGLTNRTAGVSLGLSF